MDNLIRIKQIIDHITKEPLYPKTHAIGVGYTNTEGECITVQEALDNLKNSFEVLNNYYLTLGYNENQAFPGNEGKELQNLLDSLTETIDQLSSSLADKADKDEVYTKEEIDASYATKIEVNNGLDTKQDVLLDGINIKTINDDSILGSGNIYLSNSDEVSFRGIVYKALKQGEEQMLVLKSMGSNLDVLELPVEFSKYDLNDDGVINYEELAMLYGFLTQSKYVTEDGEGNSISYRAIAVDNNLVLQKSTDGEETWVTVPNKDPDMAGYKGLANDAMDAADATSLLYDILPDIAEANNVASNAYEFEGGDVTFAIYDPEDKTIKIGFNFTEYIKTRNPNYILLTLAPSPNVLYCNSFTNKLYRWKLDPVDSEQNHMVEVNSDLGIIMNLQDRVEQLEQTTSNLIGRIELLENA